jgi:hypothetical protein
MTFVPVSVVKVATVPAAGMSLHATVDWNPKISPSVKVKLRPRKKFVSAGAVIVLRIT